MTVSSYADPFLFRRQFVAGPRFERIPGWLYCMVDATFRISYHPDLEVTQASANGCSLTLLGYICDPSGVYLGNREIVEDLLRKCDSIDSLIGRLRPYGGRWVLIWKKGATLRILHDPLGLREVCYAVRDGIVWCASQPTLLAETLRIPRAGDAATRALIESRVYVQGDSAMPGDATEYRDIRQLLPNHMLNVRNGAIERYWPIARLAESEPERAIRTVTGGLQGAVLAMASRRPQMLGMTAGWDSRVLLAACRPVTRYMRFYTANPEGIGADHPDLRISKRLLEKVGLMHWRVACGLKPEEAFLVYANRNTARQTAAEQTVVYGYFRSSQGRMNISGIGGRLVREPYPGAWLSGRPLSAAGLAERQGYGGQPLAEQAYEAWLEGAMPAADAAGLQPDVLFCWEQDIGRRAASAMTAMDIVMEQFCPFNNRLLLETMLSVNAELREGPRYRFHLALIESMWPELLTEPINPEASLQWRWLAADLVRAGSQLGGKLAQTIGRWRSTDKRSETERI